MYRLQRPDEDLDYSCDYSAELDDSGSPSDTISSSTWSLTGPDDGGSPNPVTHTPSINAPADVVTAWVKNLQPGVYVLRNVVQTAAGRQFHKQITIRCAA